MKTINIGLESMFLHYIMFPKNGSLMLLLCLGGEQKTEEKNEALFDWEKLSRDLGIPFIYYIAFPIFGVEKMCNVTNEDVYLKKRCCIRTKDINQSDTK